MEIDVILESNKGLVIICGPTTTGKTGIARKILANYEGNNGEFISYSDIWKKVNKNQNKVKREIEFSKKISTTLRNAIERKNFIVLETTILADTELYSLLTAVRILGFSKKITLILIDLDEETHINYLNNRKKGVKPTMKELKKQRKIFLEKILPNKEFDKMTNKYVINNPNDVVIKFKKN